MTEASGAPPQGGWARMVVELHVNNLKTSLSFWQEILRFGIAFERSEELFAYLEHPEGHRVSGMVGSRRGLWIIPLARERCFRCILRGSDLCCAPWGCASGQSISGRGRCGAGPEIVRADREKYSCRTQTGTCS